MNESKENPSIKSLIILIVTVVCIWLLNWLALRHSSHGTFGDAFGASNSLFSGLAFAGLLYTIILQRQELQLQKEELHLTRKELEGQKISLESQNIVLKKQNFETTFFNLLQLLNTLVNSMDSTNSNGNSVSGRDCFVAFYTRFRSNIRPDTNQYEALNHAYLNYYNKIQSNVGHYFRTLYHIIKFIDTSEVDNKKEYTNFVRAQLSSHELLLLFYNAQSDLGSEKFRPLIEKYALLKTVPISLLVNPDHVSLYQPGAFGKA